MKNFVLFLLLFFSLVSSVSAQRNMIYRWKFEALYGQDMHEVECPMAGAELALELPLFGNKNWHYTYNFPTCGFALGYLQGLQTDSMSKAIFTYPYFLWPFIHKQMFAANLKLGCGFGSYVDFQSTDKHASYFPLYNVYAGGLTFDIFLGRRYGNPLSQWQITFGGNCLILSDCRADSRWQNMLIPYANFGVKYTPNVYPLPMKHPARKVNKVWALEVSALGGVNQLDRDDDDHYYPNLSLNGGLYYPFTNAYRLGFGVDVFYNDIYDGKQRTINRRYNFIDEDKTINRFAPGIFLANDITIERFSAGLHIGLYPWKPWKVPSSYEGEDNENLTENFLYLKFVTKYKFSKHFYVTTQVKSHMQKVENFQMGISYCMPDFGDRVKNPFSRISFKKDDPDELRVDGPTNTKKPFRHREVGDE